MPKYINTEEAKGTIRRVCFGLVLDEETEKALTDAIDEMPSADVEEIVRCKYCRHSIKKNYNDVISTDVICVLKSSAIHIELHEGDYFCKDGERE